MKEIILNFINKNVLQFSNNHPLMLLYDLNEYYGVNRFNCDTC